jgi:hypothetical protein
MADDNGRTLTLTEGRRCKGGHNPPNGSSQRPPAPGGSGPKYEAARTVVCVEIGSEVLIGPPGDEVEAAVLEILIKHGPHVDYKLGWFNGKTRSTDWFGANEFRPKDSARNLGIGFKA